MNADECVEVFAELGLTRLEAEIYTYLLNESPATGYKISKGIGRSKTNTYKAIATLQSKGAIFVDDGRTCLCRAVHPDEFLEQLDRKFDERRARATEAVKNLHNIPHDQRIYQLKSVDQVYSRARHMLAECEKVAFLDLFPQPVEELREAIAAAADRGVNIAIQTYAPVEIPGVEVILNRSSADILRRRAVEWLSLFCDGKQHLIALLGEGGHEVHHASWSESPILSWAYFSYADSDFLLCKLAPLLEKEVSVEELRSIYRDWRGRFPEGEEPGYRLLAERFGWISPTN